MDSILDLLVVICLIAIPAIRKKNKGKKKAARKQAPKPETSTAQAKIPFTKDEWTAFLADMEKQEKKPKAKPAKPARAATPAKAPAPLLHLDHDEPEGTISTQGESAAEHAEHRQRILAEEARLHEQQQTLQELRHLNRQKLRSAVVMSEVLGKPVSLRPRGYR